MVEEKDRVKDKEDEAQTQKKETSIEGIKILTFFPLYL